MQFVKVLTSLFCLSGSIHTIHSDAEGGSEVEQLAKRIERRREDRLPITTALRRQMIQTCHKIQEERDYPKNRIHINDLRAYRDEVLLLTEEQEQEFHLRKFIDFV